MNQMTHAGNYGTTVIISKSEGCILTSEYRTVLAKDAQEFISKIRSDIMRIKTRNLNDYALAYLGQLESSLNLGGVRGLIGQLAYFSCNIRDAPLSKWIKKLMKELK